MTTHQLVRIRLVEPLEGRRLALTFDDGTSGIADVSELLEGPVFEEIRDSDDLFGRVELDGYGSITWPNGADLDARVLRDLTVKASTQDHLDATFGSMPDSEVPPRDEWERGHG